MSTEGFSEAEGDAIRQRAEELRAQANAGKGAAKRQREADACLAAIAALEDADQRVAQRLHTIVTEEAPHLLPKTWYGFPSYAHDGHVVVYFQPASKFGARYGTIGFSDQATLDTGDLWPCAYAVLDITEPVERELRALVRKAAG